MRRAAVLSLLLSACATASARAAPPRASIENLLAGYEPSATGDDLRGLGEGVDRVLITIARDPETTPLRRARALGALAAVPSEAGLAYCRSVIKADARKTEGMAVLDVGACAETLGAFGDKTRDELRALLSHAAPDVRIGALKGLLREGGVASAETIRRRLLIEKDEGVTGIAKLCLSRLPGPK